jgi:septin 7
MSDDSDMERFDYTNWDLATTAVNGSATAPGEKPTSPIPSNSSKAASPYVERSNPMGGSSNAQTVSSKDPKAVAQAATDMRNVVRRKLTGYVGFANLPNQWHRKSVRKGFNFNVMVVGKWK